MYDQKRAFDKGRMKYTGLPIEIIEYLPAGELLIYLDGALRAQTVKRTEVVITEGRL